jgi:hypothetical protein
MMVLKSMNATIIETIKVSAFIHFLTQKVWTIITSKDAEGFYCTSWFDDDDVEHKTAFFHDEETALQLHDKIRAQFDSLASKEITTEGNTHKFEHWKF